MLFRFLHCGVTFSFSVDVHPLCFVSVFRHAFSRLQILCEMLHVSVDLVGCIQLFVLHSHAFSYNCCTVEYNLVASHSHIWSWHSGTSGMVTAQAWE